MPADLPNDLKTLTSYRFFAAFAVYMFHIRNRIEHNDNWFWDLIENGARGVDFFFILSGFVIFHVYESKIASGDFSFKNFIVKRFARIYPLHIFIVMLFVLIAVVGNHPIQNFPETALLVHAFGISEGPFINKPSWTLSAEMFAYVLFGLLIFRRPKTWIIAVAFVVSFGLAHLLANQIGKSAFIHLTSDFGILRIIPTFILGMLLLRLMPFVQSTHAFIYGILGLALLFWIGSSESAGYEIIIPFILLILAGARLSEQPWLPTNNSFLVYLGEISYSIYLLHILVITLLIDYLPKLGFATPSLLAISLILLVSSAFTYHLVEAPARLRINQLAAGRSLS